MSWREEAACRDMDTAAFYPERGQSASFRQAMLVCRRCPVVVECLEDALEWEEHDAWHVYGLRGGLPAKSRTRVLVSRRRIRNAGNVATEGLSSSPWAASGSTSTG